MNLNLLALALHVALGGPPWDGWNGPHGIAGTPNGVWRSPFGRVGAFALKTNALRPDPATDERDPSPPTGFTEPRITDVAGVMRDLWAFPGVVWVEPIELRPYRLEGIAGEPIIEHEGDAEAFAAADLVTGVAGHG